MRTNWKSLSLSICSWDTLITSSGLNIQLFDINQNAHFNYTDRKGRSQIESSRLLLSEVITGQDSDGQWSGGRHGYRCEYVDITLLQRKDMEVRVSFASRSAKRSNASCASTMLVLVGCVFIVRLLSVPHARRYVSISRFPVNNRIRGLPLNRIGLRNGDVVPNVREWIMRWLDCRRLFFFFVVSLSKTCGRRKRFCSLSFSRQSDRIHRVIQKRQVGDAKLIEDVCQSIQLT